MKHKMSKVLILEEGYGEVWSDILLLDRQPKKKKKLETRLNNYN